MRNGSAFVRVCRMLDLCSPRPPRQNGKWASLAPPLHPRPPPLSLEEGILLPSTRTTWVDSSSSSDGDAIKIIAGVAISVRHELCGSLSHLTSTANSNNLSLYIGEEIEDSYYYFTWEVETL